MLHQPEFCFLKTALEKLHLLVNCLTPDCTPEQPLDMGIRRFLGREEEYRHLFQTVPFQMAQNTIYKLSDSFLCNYLFLLLPGRTQQAVLIGPYLTVQLTREQLLQEAEHHAIPPALFRQLETFYGSVPVLADEAFLLSIVSTYADTLWGTDNYSVVDLSAELSASAPLSLHSEPPSPDQTLLDMQTMERRYAYENELLKAVSQGTRHKAASMLTNLSQFAIEQRLADPVRNLKNYCIIMNTLLRKAVEEGGVHPLYIDSVSSDFARRIELLTSTTAAQKLMDEMLTGYCRLVKKHALGHYSAPVRKTLACIDADLAGDLSLSALADMQNISPGYLSTLFKKEVGQTLTDYVNSRRVEQAARMLRSGALQVQTIAQYCGIPDVNYFSKLFKRYIGVTPKEFRQSLSTPKEKN